MILSFTKNLSINIFLSVFKYYVCDILIAYWCKKEIIRTKLGDYHDNFYQEVTYRFNAILHATYTSIVVSLYLMGIIDPTIIDTIFINSMGYCLYDFYIICCKKYDPHKVQFIIHHLMMFFILFMNYDGEQVNILIIIKGLLAEWSTIFINLSIIFYRIGLANHKIFRLNSWITVVAFLVFRILLYPYLIYQAFQLNSYYYLLANIFYALNCLWFFKLIENHWNIVIKRQAKKTL